MDRSQRRWLWVLVIAACALRVAVVLALDRRSPRPLTYEHGEIAANLAAGRGFRIAFLGSEGPTSQQAPLYPAMLAATYWVFGAHAPAALLTMQLAQCLAGAALVALVVILCRTALPGFPAAAWAAGILEGVYPTHLYAAAHIQVAVWAALLLAALLVVALRTTPSARPLRGAALGGLAGLLVLVEPILALAAPVALAAAIGRVARAGRLALAGAWLAAALAICTPWIMRNWRVHGEFVPVKSTFGYAFWQGNNPASLGTDKIPKPSAARLVRQHDGSLAGMDRALWEARHETIYIDDLLLKPGGFRQFAGLSEPQRARLLGRQAWQFIRDNPLDYAGLCLARLGYFLFWDATNPKASHPLYRATSLATLVLAAAGLWRWRHAWRGYWPLAVVCGLVVAFHALTITSARFRIPLEPMALVWCGAAVAVAVGRLRSGAVLLYRNIWRFPLPAGSDPGASSAGAAV